MEKELTACPICASSRELAFREIILGRHEVAYLHCRHCGLLQTESPYWLDEAYGDAIASADTGLLGRNLVTASKLAVLLYGCFGPRGKYVDIAGGYGVMTRRMRDYGFDYYWDDRYCQNLMARGFEAEKMAGPFSALSAFEVLEHINDPVAFVDEQMAKYRSRTLIFTTELYEGTLPPQKDWWYYAFNTGQHISFYQRRTLEALAKRLGLNFYSLHGLHILTDQVLRIPFAIRFFMGNLSSLAAILIRRNMGSRTFADHLELVDKTGSHRQN